MQCRLIDLVDIVAGHGCCSVTTLGILVVSVSLERKKIQDPTYNLTIACTWTNHVSPS